MARIASELLRINANLTLNGGQAFCAGMERGEVALQQRVLLQDLTLGDLGDDLPTLVEKAQAARLLIVKLSETHTSTDRGDTGVAEPDAVLFTT